MQALVLKRRSLPPLPPHGSARATALARLDAERELLGRYSTEYAGLALDLGHAAAVRAIVGRRWSEYQEIYRSEVEHRRRPLQAR